MRNKENIITLALSHAVRLSLIQSGRTADPVAVSVSHAEMVRSTDAVSFSELMKL